MQDNELIDLIDNRLLPAWKELFNHIYERCPLNEKYASLWVDGFGFKSGAEPTIQAYYNEFIDFIKADNGKQFVEQLSKVKPPLSPEEGKAKKIAYLKAQLSALEVA
jgi:hypothetical protein